MPQQIINGKESYKNIDPILKSINAKKYLLVIGRSFSFNPIKDYLNSISIPHVVFDEFTPNPLYEDICKGINTFNDQKCDSIVAIGGGSTIDVAKCIKLFCRLSPSLNYLEQEIIGNEIPLIVAPSTAGSGSESTKYAVIYYKGEKRSIENEIIIPDYVILDSSLLGSLPLYQKKSAMLDALCQAIESWWSINSDDESKYYSRIAVETIINYENSYIFDGDEEASEKIMIASNYAGKAINITQTTAPHAMSYKLTTLYQLSHGHAVALCLPEVWNYMLSNIDHCIDPRGPEYLLEIFRDISQAMQQDSIQQAINGFKNILLKMELGSPKRKNSFDIIFLAKSVNLARLKNNPIILDEEVLLDLYNKILR